ncbi:MAG: cupin domain-containing protein [Chloroflexi bacterium]|nr:cupin domain-containing protein [Chloroflexota bacterium]MQC48338.1 cupin domain-containing protein [Chloroflexota bacterium]
MLKIRRSGDGPIEDRTGNAIFEGQVHGQPLVTPDESKDIQAAYVHFSPGARTRMHRHTSDQLLIVTNGVGKVGDDEGDHVIATGDSVLIPAGHDHWHGAGDTGAPMTHLTVQAADSQTTVL